MGDEVDRAAKTGGRILKGVGAVQHFGVIHSGDAEQIFLGSPGTGDRQTVEQKLGAQHVAAIKGIQAGAANGDLGGRVAAGGLREYARLESQHVFGAGSAPTFHLLVVHQRRVAGNRLQGLLGLRLFRLALGLDRHRLQRVHLCIGLGIGRLRLRRQLRRSGHHPGNCRVQHCASVRGHRVLRLIVCASWRGWMLHTHIACQRRAKAVAHGITRKNAVDNAQHRACRTAKC